MTKRSITISETAALPNFNRVQYISSISHKNYVNLNKSKFTIRHTNLRVVIPEECNCFNIV